MPASDAKPHSRREPASQSHGSSFPSREAQDGRVAAGGVPPRPTPGEAPVVKEGSDDAL